MWKRDFLPIGQILPKALLRTSAAPALQAAWVLRFWPTVRQIVFGKQKGVTDLKAVAFKDSVLTVEVPNHLWMGELRLKSTAILKEFNHKLGKPLLTKVRGRLKKTP